MVYITFGCVLIIIVMFDIVRTTLTAKGEGLISGWVSAAFRKLARSGIRNGYGISEVMGSVSILALVSIWLAGLWAGWVLVFLGIPDALEYSGKSSAVVLSDIIYFVGFTLSTLGIGDIVPKGALAQVATALASFHGLLVITLTVTYAISVIGGVVARRVLAHKIYLVGKEDGACAAAFANTDHFTAWVADIKKDLIACTEQRLAYPILDNFVNKEKKFSLAVQLARLGLAAHRENQNESVSPQLKIELNELLSVLYRYTSISGITDDDLVARLRKLGDRDGSPSNIP